MSLIERNQTHVGTICEPLESRTLLTAFQLFVDGGLVSGPKTVNYGTVPLGSNAPSHTFSYKYTGSLTVDVTWEGVNTSNGFKQTAGATGTQTLGPGESFAVTYALVTERATPRLCGLQFTYHESNGDNGVKAFTLSANVLPGNLGNDKDFGVLTNATQVPSGKISARARADGEGSTLEQVDPYLGIFELTAAQNKIDLKLTGRSMPAPPNTNVDMTSGSLRLLLSRDGNGDGKLSIAERELPVVAFSTPFIAEDSSAFDSRSIPAGKGKYLLFVSAVTMNPQNATNSAGQSIATDLGFDLTMKVDDVVPPIIEVRGPNNAVISRGATIDLGDLGAAGTADFTVTNAGETQLSVGGQRPDVSVGNFSIFEDGLNSTIDPTKSDTFRIKLTSTSGGEKSATITIASSNAQGGDFTFSVRATVPQPPLPNIKRRYRGTFADGTGLQGTITVLIRKQEVRANGAFAALRGSLDIVSNRPGASLHAETTYGKLTAGKLSVNLTFNGTNANFIFVVSAKASATGSQLKGSYSSTGEFASTGKLLLPKFVSGRSFTRSLKLGSGETDSPFNGRALIGAQDLGVERLIDGLINPSENSQHATL